MIIYKLTSPSGKSYIGQTKRGLETRLHEHYTRDESTISKAFSKYPNLEDWDISTLCECDNQDELNEAEIEYIKMYNSYYNGYNDTLGGEGFNKDFLTEGHKANIGTARKAYFQTNEGLEHKKILSERLKANNPSVKGTVPHNKGKKQSDYMTEEEIAAWKQMQADREYSDEYRKKVSERSKRLWAEGVHDNRPPPSPESIQKRIDTNRKNGFKQTDHQKQTVSEAQKSTYLVEWMDGTKEEVRGMKEFSDSSGIPYSTLSHCITFNKGTRKWRIKSITIMSSTKRILRANTI